MSKYIKVCEGRRHKPYLKFKAFLVEKGIPQVEVAKIVGKSKTALNQNLNGTGGDLSLPDVRKICHALKISADEFFIDQNVS
ncbi:helix-turn-helix domain protein [Desulfosporosinus acididurans]|uniref:Helix-turn-helix domain protein n=1 Tax=Desulfosporosinus acididurans TaxID=476652 RepID=A0A0J1FKQ3_9FIRM|nr:helix-turn-helix transcriptional regulator [Desulfosporosinus acididurans]KLU64055.1 helix-turn-helix domain protein [Desulfosporosinus acididurans]